MRSGDDDDAQNDDNQGDKVHENQRVAFQRSRIQATSEMPDSPEIPEIPEIPGNPESRKSQI